MYILSVVEYEVRIKNEICIQVRSSQFGEVPFSELLSLSMNKMFNVFYEIKVNNVCECAVCLCSKFIINIHCQKKLISMTF